MTSDPVTGAVTLYAVWETAYAFTLNLNGGSWATASDNKTQYNARDITLPSQNAPDSKFTFAGWSDNTNLSGAVTAIPSGTTAIKLTTPFTKQVRQSMLPATLRLAVKK